MNRFAELLDRLAFEPSRNGKLRLLTDYFRHTGDPDRGYALAALTGALSFANAKPALIRGLIAERVDPVLFALSYDYVGDLSETVALLWPASPQPADAARNSDAAALSTIVEMLNSAGRSELPRLIVTWLDQLDEKGRWALLKLITGGLRIGVSARLAKTALAALNGCDVNEIEDVWPGLSPPYLPLFAWLDGHGAKPAADNAVQFRTPMLAHAIEDKDFETLDPGDYTAEWKWDGIRIQVACGAGNDGRNLVRLYSRTGEDISAAFPDLVEAIHLSRLSDVCFDGELLIVLDGKVQPFGVLQQRLNRKTVSAKLMADYPPHVRAYDLLYENGEDLRPLPFAQRRARLEACVTQASAPWLDLSPQIAFADWPTLAAARADPAAANAGDDAQAVEGVMLKRADSAYVPGRPKGLWWKWKRDPFALDAVLMYAQRGHGKRSSYYSDYTFGLWRTGQGGDELVPVGKAYFGFTDEELKQLDRYVRDHTINRFGPVREVTATVEEGLVLEVAFEGVQRSTRHKSGVAMRFPRISRIRWDKPSRDADRLETLEKLIPA
ncbi:MAG TPA: cisplatin damage response ATP-dependent DNA ligase [Beijerinckiaceae bacterium]|jgi:DNA ligase-1|nr:cisplatin damage response ATP-dependent DNA ligase [Beijerinckiaceae bacterium]